MRSLLLTGLILVISHLAHGQTDFYAKRWSEVYRYELHQLPKSALPIVDTIYQRAKKEQNIVELTKSLIYQSKFSQVLEENSEILVLQKFKNEIAQSGQPLKNILESMVGKMYWQYFQENRYKYYGRTRTAEKVNADDFRTWDAQTLFEECHLYFQSSLRDPDKLQKVDLSAIDGLLMEGDNSRQYRPTLYDLLAHNALDFYSTGESLISKPSQAFVLNNSTYFTDFETMTLNSPDSLSPKLQALKIYQDLLLFHSNQKDTSAYVNVALEHLDFLLEQGTIPNAPTQHKAALDELNSRFGSHPVAGLILFELARTADKEGNKKEAVKICTHAVKSFPKSEGAKRCRQLRENLLRPVVNLTAEKFIPISKPSRILVNYTNIDTLHFYVYKIKNPSWAALENPDDSAVYRLRSQEPHLRWSNTIENPKDYHSHTTEVIVPLLEQGAYVILAQTTKSHPAKGIYATAVVQVTDLALIESQFTNHHRYQVINRNNGKPYDGAMVQVTDTYHNVDTTENKESYKSDRNGFVEVKKITNTSRHLLTTVKYKDDEAYFGSYYLYQEYKQNKKQKEYSAVCFLFSDRSIYRPGQTVHFKGILIKTIGKKSSVVANEEVEVLLENVNGEEVSSLTLTTNTFGSFSGEFKIPTTGLTGEYTLMAEEGDEESSFYENMESFDSRDLHFSVEEYKRPTFETSFKPITQSVKLNDSIKVSGQTNAFNGSKIAGAKVRYNVRRTVEYPRWFWQYRSYQYIPDQQIMHGESITNENGEFEVTFPAVPDPAAKIENRPVFQYEITVDVTDLNGETRSATTVVKAGYHTMIVTMQAPSEINRKASPHSLTVTTENLNGQPMSATGTIRIFKLKGPDTPVRTRPWPTPDLPIITREEFKRLFPNETYGNSERSSAWEKGEPISEINWNTAVIKDVRIPINKNWALGKYLIELESKDPAGGIATDLHQFTVTDPLAKEVGDNALILFELDKSSYRINETARLKIGTASEDATITIDVIANNRLHKTFVEHLSKNVKEIFIPITQGIAEGFTIQSGTSVYNGFLSETRFVSIETEKPKLEIEILSFKDKIQPGTKETWSFQIKGNNDTAVEAEVLASMYDQSLDQFKPHAWFFNPNQQNSPYQHSRISPFQSFGITSFYVRNQSYNVFIDERRSYDQFDWFGFSITNNQYLSRNYLNRLYSTGPDHNNPSKVHMRNTRNGRKGFIYGTITTSDGEPLPGVNILIKGTTTGTTSDFDGHYGIEADKGDVLVYSFVGYGTAEAKVGGKNTINVLMEEEVMALSELVVTGYGTQIKREMTASVAMEREDSVDINMDSDAVFQKLEGRAAGVVITGEAGAANRIMIRGNSDLSGNSEPLYVVDGVIMKSGQISQSDLANIQVLRGPSATALYGSRGVNGAVIITTKPGQKKLEEEMATIAVRKDLNETAFFFPHLKTDIDGRIRFTFTSPEALTRWKLQLMAHTRDLVHGTNSFTTVTQKELMVTPNAPRFVRVGDEIVFATRIANLTQSNKTGKVSLLLTDATSGKTVNSEFSHTVQTKPFQVKGKGSTEVQWRLKVPEGVDALQYKVVAKAGNYSDGEQNAIPVLSDKMLVTETISMYVRSGQTKTFTLEKLKQNTSSTLEHHQLTLEVTSNPVWYAIQSLPYLMEFPHDCAEQIFSRYYSNALATSLINSQPRFQEVFKKWKDSPEGLQSNLEKNEALKSILLQETPWVRDAASESEQKRRIGLLFDLQKMKEQLSEASAKLKAMQFDNGGFPWFAGSDRPNRFITQHIIAGFGHLKQLDVTFDHESSLPVIQKAIGYLDNELVVQYERLVSQAKKASANAKSVQETDREVKAFLDKRHTYDSEIHYLYMRSFYPEIPLSDKAKEAVSYYRDQTLKFWREFSLYNKAMTALIHHRNKNSVFANSIVASLKENSIVSDELGRYWKENTGGWHWYEAPVETHVLLLEAIAEVEASNPTLSTDEKQTTLDELRIWLMKHKQTNHWSTTKSTTEAIYALMLYGSAEITKEHSVDVTIGKEKVNNDTNAPEAGTGYFRQSWGGSKINNEMATVTLTKTEPGIAWGGLYWQYFEKLDNITGAETPLKLSKKVFKVEQTDKGSRLTEIDQNAGLKVGDLLRIRIELSTDRPMEFLHMKDMRASGLEPVDVLSQYKRQDGLGYYQSTKDAATHFFFDEIPKGVYVFEYDLRVNNKGNFSNGITTIQSMYAPEFSSHSEGIRIFID